MPPIPVHIDDPITPAKADGVTPQTSDQPAAPANNATTTAQSHSPAYPPARPGAAAVPGPTPYVPRPQAEVTRTTQPSLAQNAPPPPQPGAVPIPPSQQAPMTAGFAASTLPPPPKPGEAAQQRQTSMSMPSQMNVPPPQQNYAPTHSTTGIQQGGPTTVNLGPVAQGQQAQRPPGYQQNVYAQEMSSAQRSSIEQQERRESVVPSMGFGGAGAGDTATETAGNMWNTVKGWASTAGEKLVETEESVWKRINGAR